MKINNNYFNKGKYITKRIIAIFLLIILLGSEIAHASDLTAKKEEIESQIDKVEKNVANVKAQKTNALKQIEELEKSIMEIDRELQKIDKQLDDVNDKMKKAEKELEEIVKKRDEHYEALKLRMRDMYENSTISYLDMFLQSKSFVELIDAAYNINLIMKKDNEVLESIKTLENEAQIKKTEIEEKKVEVELLKSKQEAKKYAVEANLAEQEKLKNNLSMSEKNYMNQLNTLEAAAKEIDAMISGKVSKTDVYDGKAFVWPVPGYTYLSSTFGYRSGFYLQDGSWNPAQNHGAIDIPAPKGTPIKAAAAGKVIIAGWVRGYGYTVMIDHGSNLLTLYGHNSALLVKVGQTVSAGQQIAKCGSTGDSTGNHCHFEVRKDGKKVDPLKYVSIPKY